MSFGAEVQGQEGDAVDRWLLLRGLTREARHWGRFRGVLERRLGVSTFTLDLPGFGTEAHRTSPMSVSRISDDVRERWAALKSRHPGRWGLATISLGSMVGLDWCGRFGSDFERLVIINSSAANLSPPVHRLRLGMVPKLIAAIRQRDPVAKERVILSLTTRLVDCEDVAVEWGRFAAECPPKKSAAIAQLVGALLFSAPPRLDVPLLILSSGADAFTDPRCSRRLAEHFGAPIRIHAGAGHDLPLDDPEWVAEEIHGWVRTSRKDAERAQTG